MSYFVPRDQREHREANRGYDVPDYCRNCNEPFMNHHNGRCTFNDAREAAEQSDLVAREEYIARHGWPDED